MQLRGGTIKGCKHAVNEFKTAGNWSTASNWSLGKIPTTEIAFINANCTFNTATSFTGRLIISEGVALTISSGFSNGSALAIGDITVLGTLTCNASNFYFTKYLKFGPNGIVTGSQAIRTRTGTIKIISQNQTSFISCGVQGGFSGSLDMSECVGSTLSGVVLIPLINGASITIPQKFTFNGAVSVDRASGISVSNALQIQQNDKLVTFNSTANFNGSTYSGAYSTWFKGNITLGLNAATAGGTLSSTFILFETLNISNSGNGSNANTINCTSALINSGKTLTISRTNTGSTNFNGILNGVDGTATLVITALGFNYSGSDLMVLGTLTCQTGSTVNYSGATSQNIKSNTYENLTVSQTSGTNTKTLLGNTTVNGNLIVDRSVLNRNGFTLTVIGTTTLLNGGTII